MVTPSDTSGPAAPPASPPSSERKPRPGRRGGGKAGGQVLAIGAINRRVEALQKLEDSVQKKKGRQRLLHNILTGIADGSVKQPNKAAEAVLTLMRAKVGKGKGKGAAAEALFRRGTSLLHPDGSSAVGAA